MTIACIFVMVTSWEWQIQYRAANSPAARFAPERAKDIVKQMPLVCFFVGQIPRHFRSLLRSETIRSPTGSSPGKKNPSAA
jgi:hypothetical protein